LLVTDFGLPPLLVKRTDRRIVVEGGAFDLRQVFDIARPGIDALGRSSRRGCAQQIVLAGDIIAGVRSPVADLPDQIANVRRAKHRDDQIGAVAESGWLVRDRLPPAPMIRPDRAIPSSALPPLRFMIFPT
jgi:hypothetical protein